MIIIPDVHGRTFWKEAVEKANEGEKIVFLGDYVDPYSYQEGIDAGESFSNFTEILQYKEEHDAQVTLLLGNHDLHYVNSTLNGGRRSWEYSDRISDILKEKTHLFRFAYYADADKTYVFSHAGFQKGWLKEEYGYDGNNVGELLSLLDRMNDEMRDDIYQFSKRLAYVSYIRGGMDSFGSPIWADVHEYTGEEPVTDGV